MIEALRKPSIRTGSYRSDIWNRIFWTQYETDSYTTDALASLAHNTRRWIKRNINWKMKQDQVWESAFII